MQVLRLPHLPLHLVQGQCSVAQDDRSFFGADEARRSARRDRVVGAVVTQVIPRAVRLRPIQHRVEICDACLPHRVSRRLYRGSRSWPWRPCCGSARRSRQRNPLQRRQRLSRCRMRTARQALEPLKSRSRRQRRRTPRTSRLIRRAAPRAWRARHASSKPSSPQKSCSRWPSSSPLCARRRLMRV